MSILPMRAFFMSCASIAAFGLTVDSRTRFEASVTLIGSGDTRDTCVLLPGEGNTSNCFYKHVTLVWLSYNGTPYNLSRDDLFLGLE